MFKKQKPLQKILLVIGVVTFLLILIFVKVSFRIKSPGQILPIKEWLLTRSADGNFIQTLINHQFNVIEEYRVVQIERGDVIQFQLNPRVYQKGIITRGDTVGIFSSNELERELARLRGELEVENSTLDFYLSGEKPSIIEEAKQRLEYARKNVEEQEKIYQRQKDLYQKGLISQQEYELIQSALELYKIEVNRAQAQLSVVTSGAKESQIKFSQNRIQALQDEITTLKNRLNHFTITAPISGKLVHSNTSDTVLIILDTTSFVIKMAIKIQNLEDTDHDSRVNIHLLDSDLNIITKLSNLDNAVHLINGRQVVYGTAFIDSQKTMIHPGSLTECSIEGHRISLLNYFLKDLNFY